MTPADASQQTGGAARGIWAWWPLRLIVLFVVLVALYIGCQMTPHLLNLALPALSRSALAAIGAAVVVVAMSAAYRLLVGWMERRPVAELAAKGALAPTLVGVALGAGLFTAVYLVLYGLGVARFEGFGTTDRLVMAIAFSLAAAVGEEIVFRGVVFRIVEEGMGTAAALIVSAALFGAIHASNPNATAVSSAAIMLEAGVLLAAAYALTRTLWLPIGLHFAWNFAEGGIFGAAVSGNNVQGLLKAPIAGPELLSGGRFGPEASLVAVVLCLSAALILLFLAVRRGEWRPLHWRLKI